MTLDRFMSIVVLILARQEVTFIVYGILADFVLAVAASIKTKEFRLAYLAAFIQTKLLPYVLGYIAASLVAYVQPDLVALPTGVWAAIELALLGDIFAALQGLGLPIPVALTKPEYLTLHDLDLAVDGIETATAQMKEF